MNNISDAVFDVFRRARPDGNLLYNAFGAMKFGNLRYRLVDEFIRYDVIPDFFDDMESDEEGD